MELVTRGISIPAIYSVALIDCRHYGLLVAMHLLPDEIRETMNESDDE